MKPFRLVIALFVLAACSPSSFKDVQNIKDPRTSTSATRILNSINFNLEDKKEALQLEQNLKEIKPVLVIKNLNALSVSEHCTPSVGKNIANKQRLTLVKQQLMTDAHHTISFFRFGSLTNLDESVELICEYDRGTSKTFSEVTKDLNDAISFYSDVVVASDFSKDFKDQIQSEETVELNQLDVFAPAYYGSIAQENARNENVLRPQALILDINHLIVLNLREKGDHRCEILGSVPEDLKRSQKMHLYMHSGSRAFLSHKVFTILSFTDAKNLNYGFQFKIRCESSYGVPMTFAEVAKDLEGTLQFISGK